MQKISSEDFSILVKKERAKLITPYDLAYKSFVDLGYVKKDPDFFRTNASEFIENMRSQCWSEFVPYERDFTKAMLRMLIYEEAVKNMDPVSAIESFVEEYPKHIYDLSLSNTQSRRARAGKEFEAIIELLLIGADVPSDSQGSIGKTNFSKQGLGKLVDIVSPGVVQYLANKRNTTLISAKTTLRERWQEVPEEVTRTGTREMYLATLDDNITDETLRVLYEANVIIVTTKNNQNVHYSGDNRVISFEDLISIATDAAKKWSSYVYTDEEKEGLSDYLKKQYEKHYPVHPFVYSYYEKRLNSKDFLFCNS